MAKHGDTDGARVLYIDNVIDFTTYGIGNLFLFLQWGNNFNGRVLIDNIELKSNFNQNTEIEIFNNFFSSSRFGRFKESIYIKFKPIFLFYKLLRSIVE